jgi:hypothetical protein
MCCHACTNITRYIGRVRDVCNLELYLHIDVSTSDAS